MGSGPSAKIHAPPPTENIDRQQESNPAANASSWHDVYQYYHDYKHYAPGIIFSLVIIAIIWFFTRLTRKLYKMVFPAKKHNRAIEPPSTFKSGTDVREWLEKFELYANANFIYDKHEKGKALLSRLDEETFSMLKLIRKKSIKQPSLFSWTKKNSDDV